MKSVLSSIDLICVARELTELKGAVVKKIYQVGDEIIFHLYHGGEKIALRVVVGKIIHLTNYLKENPQVPSNFCMYLRKYVKGARLVGVSQPRFERIIVLRFQRGDELLRVVFELFSSGNVIVSTDDGVIKQCLKVQRFAARVIKPHSQYDFPPSEYDLSVPDIVSFKRVIKLSGMDALVKTLAVDIGIGGAYAEEACLIAGVDKDVNPVDASDEVIKKVFDSILEILKKAKYLPLEPRVILSGERVVDVTPFQLKFYEGKGSKEFPSFNEALDFFYARSERLDFEGRKLRVIETKRSKLLDLIKHYENHVDELRGESVFLKDRAMALKTNFYNVKKVIDSLLNARRSGYDWSDILQMIEKEKQDGSSDALLVKDLLPNDNLIILDLVDGIEMPLTMNVRDFMDNLFERGKKLESKIDGALEAVERAKKALEDFRDEDVKLEVNVPKRTDSSGKEWFERFKWFRTTEGNLVISGRNAQQNEEIIRKYLEPDDLVFHADIHGSPFTVLRNGRKAGDDSKREAAEFTAAHSSAWDKGVAIDVFYILPYQVSKDAPSGEYLRTGGFMIRGKKEYFKSLKPELCLGVEVLGELTYRFISGPRSVVKVKSKVIVTLEPGSDSQSSVIKEVIESLKQKGFIISFETVKAALPSGGLRITGKF